MPSTRRANVFVQTNLNIAILFCLLSCLVTPVYTGYVLWQLQGIVATFRTLPNVQMTLMGFSFTGDLTSWLWCSRLVIATFGLGVFTCSVAMAAAFDHVRRWNKGEMSGV